MAAMSAVAPVLNKAPVVSTGKAANTNSMMVWQPHGNKCVPASRAAPVFRVFFADSRETNVKRSVRARRDVARSPFSTRANCTVSMNYALPRAFSPSRSTHASFAVSG
jgi:hypothetical protein